jgi:hypothetical protein
VQNLFFEQTRDPFACLGLVGLGDKGDALAFEFREGPAEDFLKSGVQVRDAAVEVEGKDRIRQKV